MTDSNTWSGCLSYAIERSHDFIEFWESINHGAIKPRGYQARRLYKVVEGGRKRVLLADSTSAGKTFVSVAAKGLIDRKLGRKTRALVMAPEQALRTAWREDEVNKYLEALGRPPQTVGHVTDRASLRKARHTDFFAINQHKLGYTLSDNVYADYLAGMAREFDVIVLDEVHNFKNPARNRTLNLQRFVEKTLDKYFLLLSATPVPNRLEDMGTILYLLNPQRFRLEKFDYNANPGLIKSMMEDQIFVFTRDDLREIFELNGLDEGTLVSPVDIDTAQAYLRIWGDGDIHISDKYVELQRLLNASKIPYVTDFAQRTAALDPDSQFLIFSYLKEGTHDELSDALSQVFPKRVGVINGDVPFEDRIRLAEEFRRGEKQALVNSIKTMGEGIPLTTGERPVYLIFLQPPPVPGHYDQAVGRSYRLGQIGPVYVRVVLSDASEISQGMLALKPELEDAYGRFNPSWRPTLVDTDGNEIREVKQEIIRDKIYKGVTLTNFEQAVASAGDVEEMLKKGIIKSIPRLKPRFDTNKQRFMSGVIASVRLYGAGRDEMLRARDGPEFGKLREGYVYAFEGSPAYTNLKFLERVIEGLEGLEDRRFLHMADLGSGPACLSQVLGRPITNVDIDKLMLEAGRDATCGLGAYINAAMQDLPFSGETFDLVNASYSLMYAAQRFDRNWRREIEDTLIEVNRVEIPGGYFLVTLPHKRTSDKEFDEFVGVADKYGFAPKIADFFTAYRVGSKKEKVSAGVYLFVGKKSASVDGYVIPPGFKIYVPSRYARTGGERVLLFSGRQSTKSSTGDPTDVQYLTRNGESLDSIFAKMSVPRGDTCCE